MPPSEAFDHIRRRPPPNLPGPKAAPGGTEQQRAIDLYDARQKHEARRRQQQDERLAKKHARAAQKPVNPARHRRRRRVAAVLAVVALVAAGVVLSVNLLFKIEKFDLQGDAPYTVEQLAEAFGYAVGDNMYGFSASAAAERITTRLPYVQSVAIRRRLPSTIVFHVTRAEEGYCLPWQEGYAVLSTGRKVLKITGERPEGLTRIDGLTGLAVEPGAPLALTEEAAAQSAAEEDASASGSGVSGSDASGGDDSGGDASGGDDSNTAEDNGSGAEDAGAGDSNSGDDSGEDDSGGAPPPAPREATPTERFTAMEALLEALSASGLEDITWVDVADPLELRFRWENRITVLLGPRSGMEEKMAALVVLLDDSEQNLIDPKDAGTLDMSFYTATGRSYFDPD